MNTVTQETIETIIPPDPDVPDTPDEPEAEPEILYTSKITITHKTWTEMADFYNFSPEQRELLTELMTEDYDLLTSVVYSLDSLTPEARAVLKNLPDDLDPARRRVVEAAMSLVGKVPYFWGGKHYNLGFDPYTWLVQRVIDDHRSTQSNKYRSYGLDCSGYTSWVFMTAAGDRSAYGVLGDGVDNQHARSVNIPYSSAQPGDLAFFANNSHMGVVVGWDEDGNILVAHCGSSKNNVVIGEFSASGFATVGVPNWYDIYGGGGD
jgi:cell wall-associated NlpC family hydrolase